MLKLNEPQQKVEKTTFYRVKTCKDRIKYLILLVSILIKDNLLISFGQLIHQTFNYTYL